MSHAEGIHLAPSLRHASDETLISRARAGDSAAREALILRHQSLVRHIAVAFRNAGFSNEDLMQAGTVGLIAAVDRFRPEHGVWFATYAGAVIRGELQHLLRDHGWAVRVPRPLQDLGRAANTNTNGSRKRWAARQPWAR